MPNLNTFGSANGANSTVALPGTDLNSQLSQQNHLPGQNYFDPSVNSSLIPAEQQKTAGYYQGALNQNVTPNSVSGPSSINSSDPMVQALSNRYNTQTQTAVNSITGQNNANAPVLASANESAMEGQLGAEYNNQVQNFAQQYAFEINRQTLYNNWQTAQNQAQSGLYGQIFGGIGKAGGTAAGIAAIAA